MTSEPAELNFGFNFYNYDFPNYKSLAAQTKGQEYSAPDTGENTFNFKAWSFSASGKMFLTSKITGYASSTFNLNKFVDQKIVVSNGNYQNKKRSDKIMQGTIGTNYLMPQFTIWGIDFKTILGLSVGLKHYNSDQNHYHAGVFISDYYDYTSISISPILSVKAGERCNISMSYSTEKRKYSDRLIQDTSGAYGTEKLEMTGNNLGLTASYKIWKELAMQLRWLYYDSGSNTKYEATYQYNYYGNSTFAGLYYKF